MTDDYDARVIDSVVKNRSGQVLGKLTILKTEEIPGDMVHSLTPRISGSTNYRKSPTCNTYSVGRTTTNGIRTICQLIGAKINRVTGEEFPDTKPLIWCSLREEPVIFINGRTCVIRKLDDPFHNLQDHHGINGNRVDLMEQQLKQDILAESLRYRGLLLIHAEVTPGEVLAYWEYIQESSVITSSEVFRSLLEESYLVKFQRIPLAPEAAPSPKSIDYLVDLGLKVIEENYSVVLNCQTGRGRSTFAAVILGIISRQQSKCSIKKSLSRRRSVFALQEIVTAQQVRQNKKCQFKVITNLLRVLERGNISKLLADQVIEDNAQVQHLIDAILATKLESDKSSDPKVKQELLQRSIYFLERYVYIIVFSEYIYENPSFTKKFSTWLEERNEIRNLLSLIKDPAKAFYQIEEGEESEFSKIVSERSGTVLGNWSIIKPDFRPQSQIATSYRFEMLPLYMTAQPTVEELEFLFNDWGGGPQSLSQVWLVNLRLEPHVYINGSSFVLRDIDQPKQQLNDYKGIELSRLEKMERRLKQDIITEARKYKNKIVVHSETETGELVPLWQEVDIESVLTMKELCDRFSKQGYKLRFWRIPLSLYAFSDSIFDELLQVVKQSQDSTLVFNSSTGSIRAVVALIIALLIQKREPDTFSLKHSRGFFNPIKRLVQVLPDALLAKNQVDFIIDKCGMSDQINLRNLIYTHHNAAQGTDNTQNKEENLKLASTYLEMYFKLIVFASYLRQQDKGDQTFVTWSQARPEISSILLDTRNYLVAFAQIDAPLDQPATVDMNDHNAVVRARDGPVLQASHILKSDHFPGCHKDWLPPLTGAPNYRQVEGLPIYGVGIPTGTGLDNVLAKVNWHKHVLWISLREEPVVYINGSPYVLRDNFHPFRNLEYAGIAGSHVEEMEKRLREDVLAEARKYGGKILLHDEEDHNGEFIMTKFWETVKESSVCTTRQIYEEAAKRAGVDLAYYRVPVSDEKTMQEQNFDDVTFALRNTLEERKKNFAIVFNCQMGQGRTTTGMTVATVFLQSRPDYAGGENDPEGLGILPRTPLKQSLATASINTLIITGMGEGSSLAVSKDYPYLKGEYNSILNLIRVISGGNAKRHLDFAIDRCSTVINLREAIHQTHVKSEMKPHYFHTALNFLERYFYLLAYTQYVLEEMAKKQTGGEVPFQKSFGEWMLARPEVKHLLANITLV